MFRGASSTDNDPVKTANRANEYATRFVAVSSPRMQVHDHDRACNESSVASLAVIQ